MLSNRLLLLLVTCIICFTSYSQNVSITGKVQDSDGQALSFSTIMFFQDTSLIKGTISQEDGSFELDLEPGQYALKISYVGFEEYEQAISAVEDTELGMINLNRAGQALSEVMVTDFRNEVKAGIDKKVINISEGLRSATTSLSEILEMVPIVFMDMEGNPKIPGKQDVIVLVDGREPNIRANDLATVLRLIPSSQILKIEIMTNPPTKYTKTNAAVINVVTNKAPQEGAILNAWLSTDALNAHGGGGNFTLKRGKFSVSAWGGRWAWKNKHEYRSTRTNYNVKELHRIEEENELNYNGYGYYMGVSPEYQINDKNIISAYVGTYNWNNENDNDLSFQIFNDDNERIDFYDREDFALFKGNGFYSGIEYFKYFEEEEKELNFDVGFDFYSNESSRNGALFKATPYYQRFTTFRENPSFEFSAEYFDPIDSTSSLNYALEFNRNFPYESKQDFFFGNDAQNLVKGDDFSYVNNLQDWEQEFNITYSKKFKKTTVSLDLGQVYYKIDYEYDRSSTVDRDFLFIIPKVSINQKISESNEIGLSYKYGSEAPMGFYLNPNIRFSSDGLWRQFGNPDLEPERSHELESNFGFYLGKFNIGTTAFWRYSNNAIQSYSTVDADGIRNNTFENNGEYTRAGVQLSVSGSIQKKLSVNLSGSIYDSKIVQENRDDLQTLGYDMNGSLRYFLPKDFTLSFSCQYQGPELSIQGERNAFYTLRSSLRKSLWNNKINISLMFNDLARSINYVSETQDKSFFFTNDTKRLPAFWGIRLNCKFGQLKEQPKSSKVGGQGG